MNKEICKSCGTINHERYWAQVGDKWVCAYCYNPTYTKEKIIKLRTKQEKGK